MKYFATYKDGYVASFGTADHAVFNEITNEQYIAILAGINYRPTAPSGYTYKLRADNLEWELVELPEPVDDDATAADYEAALNRLGVGV